MWWQMALAAQLIVALQRDCLGKVQNAIIACGPKKSKAGHPQ
jgi:hypothetical protein